MKKDIYDFPFKTILALIIIALTVSLFNHWEPGGESWQYWTFEHIFSETGKFIMADRSPLYILYFKIFWGLGYPASFITEYFVSTLITAISLLVLFRRYLYWPWLTLAVICWIPFLQILEPQVSKLALACVCFGVALRDIKPTRFRRSLSYALFFLAGMFRPTFVLSFGVFLVYDLFRTAPMQIPLKNFLPTRYDWPIFIVIVLLIWFHMEQSPQRWNNPWGVSQQWLAAGRGSLFDAAFIDNLNMEYREKMHTTHDQDMYDTNKITLGGAKNIFQAIQNSPKLVFRHLLNNIKYDIIMASRLTLIPASFDQKFRQGSLWWYPVHLFITLPVLCLILYGAFRGCRSEIMLCFFVSCVLMMVSLIITMPRERYMHPMVPVLFLSLSWYALRAKDFRGWRHHLFLFLLVMLFSTGLLAWSKIGIGLVRDISRGTLSVMQARPVSMVMVKPQVEPIVKNCRGILAFDHLYWAALLNKPLDQFYDIYEIPPFGTYANSPYHGLRPDRIDCVILSGWLVTGRDLENVSAEQSLRYEHYIKPYVQYLTSLGAKTYNIPDYGKVIKLER